MTTATRPLCRTDPTHGPSLVRELCSPCYQAQRRQAIAAGSWTPKPRSGQRGEVAGLMEMWRRMFS